jgi:YidC/Oxa1 family membrane protein insertase
MSEYQHRPDQGPGGDKQFLLYMMLAFVLVVMLQGIFSRQAPKPANTPATPPAVNTQPSPTPAPPAAEALAAVPQNVQSKQASAEGDVTVEDDLFRVVLTNRGAQAKSWQLKKYKNDKGQTLDLVNQKGADLGGWPLSLWTYDEALRKRLNEALYVVSVDGCKNVSGQTIKVKSPAADQSCEFSQQMSLTYDFADADLSAHKKITFESGYVVAIEAAVLLKGVPVPAFPAWPSSFGDQVSAANYASSKVDWHTAEGNNHLPAFEKNIIRPNKWVMGGATLRNEFNWIGASDEYFAAVFMPANPRSAVAVTLNQPLEIPKDPAKPDPNETVRVPVVGVAVGDVSGITGERLYVGPKDFDVLRRVRSNGSDGAAGQGPNLEGVVDFGTFGIFARWLFDWLNWTHDHLVQNWGWAIIVLTVIINLALLPTRVSMMRTQLKMQKVAPFAQAINKKYEKYGFRDTEKQQQKQAEIMAMYKEHDVSPFNLAGCLPMFIQLPILYAFYAVLANTIELRQAAWMWIRDLSSPDPWHILPIATIASMMILQRMTPQAGMDPAQRRMMNVMMPVMFGFITWAVSAGLALYWTVGNLISLGQQYVMNRTHLGREIQELQAKRARKSQK